MSRLFAREYDRRTSMPIPASIELYDPLRAGSLSSACLCMHVCIHAFMYACACVRACWRACVYMHARSAQEFYLTHT